MSSEIDRYLQEDSPFLPEVELTALNSIIRDLALEQGYYVGEATAKALRLHGTTSAARALSRKSSERTATPENLAEYIRGFDRPLQLLQIAYAGVGREPEAAEKILSWLPELAERDFLLENIAFAVDLLKTDLSGVKLVSQIVHKELLKPANLYYKVGLEAARRTFAAYVEVLNTIIPYPNIPYLNYDIGQPDALYQRLGEYEKTAPTSLKPLPEETKRLVGTLAKYSEHPSFGTALLMFLKHPSLIPHLFSLITRLLYHSFKNPDVALRELRKMKAIMPKIQEATRGEWQSGELVKRLEPEFVSLQDRLSRIVPPTPYPSKDFVRDIQRIRDLRERVISDEANDPKQLLDEWKRLAERPGLEEYPALWTAVHIAFGDFAERQFALTGEKRFVRAARRAYSTPLKKSTLWKADPGTRYMCAARLGELYCKYGGDLEMPALELARAIYDAYFNVLTANERLYQRSPFRESKERLQARSDLAVARIIESCVYLSERSETESVKWRQEAFMFSENGKSRMLREEMALAERLPPTGMPSELYDAETRRLNCLHEIYAKLAGRQEGSWLGMLLPEEFDDLKEKLNKLCPELKQVWAQMKMDDFDEFNKARNELRLELEQVWAQMEDWAQEKEDYKDAVRAYVSVRRDEAIQWGDLEWDAFQRVAEHLGEKVALISLSTLPDSVFLSVLRAGWEAPKVRIVPLKSVEFRKRYLQSYYDEILKRPRGYIPRNAYAWQELGNIILAPLEPLLADVELVYFLPHGRFHRLPLHALTVNGKPFIERWAVAYAPSVSVLESTLSRPTGEGSVLVMGYASPNDPRKTLTELILREANEVARHFHILPKPPEDANAAMVTKHGPSARLIHLSCHGAFDPKEPLESGIDLADGRFTARDWLRLRLRANLVTLSACQTGMSDIRPGDDLVGLMRAILFAGTSSLLMTLWSVDAGTTLDWMLKFYPRVWDEKGVQIADKASVFRCATLELKEEWPDPYYWAPFILVGDFH